MLIRGSSKSEKTNILIDSYVKLIDCGVSTCDILVLTLNGYKKNKFIEEVKKRSKCNFLENLRVYSFSGLAYNAIKDNWVKTENAISGGKSSVEPNLTSLEVSQYLFRQSIKKADFKDYNSKINLMHQLFRRYSLIVQNDLTPEELANKAQMLGESFFEDTQIAINDFKKRSLNYRAFDYIRQLSILKHLYTTTDYFKNIKYLLVDDADEITNAQYEFIKYLKPQLKDCYIAYDRYGNTRAGFLNADIKIIEKLENLFNDKPKNLDNYEIEPVTTTQYSFSKRLEMLNTAIQNAAELVDSGVNPSEISIITPITDSALKFRAKEIFTQKNIDYVILSGSEKLSENPFIKNILTLLKLTIPDLKSNTDIFDIRSVLSNLLGIPVKYCMKIVSEYKQNGILCCPDLNNITYEKSLTTLIETIEKLKNTDDLLSQKIINIYESVQSLNTVRAAELAKLNFLLKEIKDFEKVFPENAQNTNFQKKIIIQLENTIISENPADIPDIEKNSVVIATAQKIIDLGIKTKYQFWLDTTSAEWTREDTGTLYNSWVFQKSWDKDEFTFEDNLKLTETKIKRQLRKLSLLTDKITAYSSLFDICGIENQGGLENYININSKNQKQNIEFKFTPREDQKPVLDYKKGEMAISAVPGAGKTTILLALIIEMLKKGVNSENIFVLTYMDSAARNFKERIKAACPYLESLPNISTIHGLALRILKENGNYTKAGLTSDFEICDENLRQRIIRELISALGLEQDDFDKYEKAVSILKLSCCDEYKNKNQPEIQRFLKLFNSYNQVLKNRNIIDYDDMLSQSVKILEKNPDILKYYQDICKYIIEDEAQDSSHIQQKLIGLLSAKHKNLIRCGDLNQSITTTFTNADMKGFTDFIKSKKNVTMTSSQRCNEKIYSLANDLIDYAKKNELYKDAFFNSKMCGVDGKNPDNKNAVTIKLFEEYNEERSFLVSKIREIFAKKQNADIAILVRNNFQITEYSSYLSSYGFNVVTRTDTLNRVPVFNLIFTLIKFIEYPWQNEKITEFAKVLNEQKFTNFTQSDFDFIHSMKEPFITSNADEIESQRLSQLHWDLNYWLENSTLSPDEFALKAGSFYYSSDVEKSNIYMISIFLKKMSNQYRTTSELIDKIDELSQKNMNSIFKLFSEEESDIDEKVNKEKGKIQIMTYHKSKGDEFDFVFIPQLTEEILPLDINAVKIKSSERFLEYIKSMDKNYSMKNEHQLKILQAEENLRLFYVALTRAKMEIYITSAKKYKKFSRIRETKHSLLFDEFLKVTETT